MLHIGVLDRIAWSFLHRLESLLVLRSAIVLKLAPPDSVPVNVAGLLEFLQVICIELLKAISFKSSNAIE